MELLLHEKDVEISWKLLPLKIEFGEIGFKGGIHGHHMFMKKNKLACGTILNVVDYSLHHVTCVNNAKET